MFKCGSESHYLDRTIAYQLSIVKWGLSVEVLVEDGGGEGAWMSYSRFCKQWLIGNTIVIDSRNAYGAVVGMRNPVRPLCTA